MRKTSVCAAVLALGALTLSVPAFAQSSPAAPTGTEMPRNQPPKGNVGTSSRESTDQSGSMKSGAMKSGSKKSDSLQSSSTKSSKKKGQAQSSKGSRMGTTGAGPSVQTPGNPNNTGMIERSRNLPGKGNIDNSTPPGR